ncbi:winged helix DNA-binding domain-containing protein [Litorilinea aerophila]|uniref:Winged helix DNA-binding domain-containing protein n=1 Tax=Litorilinea aerophila TaxID=1204385 RepID=A0A540VIJ9_9CHLR|nr:winged helix DNA-binding domain-containing protein [Litorilinea aerophila]MCC9075824.1 winged helix DNA-binding domain-containing protein [Litorilinea aerophila]
MPSATPLRLTPEQVRWFRLQRSGLVHPYASPEEAASALVGVQAQILSAAGLSLWNRTAGLTYTALEERLYHTRTLVKLWGQRGTLHLYPSREWPLLHGARSINRTWWERRRAHYAPDGTDYATLVEQVAGLLRSRESMGRSDLRAADLDLHEDLYSAWGGIFADLVRLGHACHAGRVGNEGHFAHRERWLPDLAWNPPPAHEANQEIARRYLATYGPATAQDFAYWRGAPMGQARRWLNALEPELASVQVGGAELLALASDLEALASSPPEAEAWPVAMLYRFDPLLLAHRDKGWVTAAQDYKKIWRPAGHIEGIVLAHGRAQATWRYDRKAAGLHIRVEPFHPLPRHVSGAIPRLAQAVADFFDLPLAELTLAPSHRGTPG